MSALPYTCPEHPRAQIRHSWDQSHYVMNGYPSGAGVRSNHRYECAECGRELALEAPNAELQRERDALETAHNIRNDEVTGLIAMNEALKRELESALSLIGDIAKINRDVPDAIDNDGQPYQSAALDIAIKAAEGKS